MEGTLLKWTNYFNGWQPRYFILEDGVLSYYYSQDDINNSCKGSIKIAACDINAHNTDSTRLDIIVPGEAHYYLKAATPHDRQMWLVVLGTCKASNNNAGFLVDNKVKNENEKSASDLLKLKKSQLHTYYDILTQHTYNIKMAIKNKSNPDYQMLNESTTMIGETCESFINSLDECLQLVESKYGSSSSYHCKSSDSPSSFKNSAWGSQPQPRLSSSIEKRSISRGTSKEKEHSSVGHPIHNSAHLHNNLFHASDSNNNNNLNNSNIVDALLNKSSTSQHHSSNHDPDDNNFNKATRTSTTNNNNHHTSEILSSSSTMPISTPSIPTNAAINPSTSDVPYKSQYAVVARDNQLSIDQVRLPTFFSQMPVSFVDIKLVDNLGVPTTGFIDSCRSFINIFDKLNKPAFTPAKLDMSSNVKKIHQKYVTSPEKFSTIQQIIKYEMSVNQSRDANSATQAILWLTKSLEFAKRLMEEMICRPDEDDIQSIINDVYKDVFMNYHSWVLRSAFSIASSSSPPKSEIISCLCTDLSHHGNPAFVQSLVRDIEDYASSLGAILNLLQLYFDSHSLHIDIDESL